MDTPTTVSVTCSDVTARPTTATLVTYAVCEYDYSAHVFLVAPALMDLSRPKPTSQTKTDTDTKI